MCKGALDVMLHSNIDNYNKDALDGWLNISYLLHDILDTEA